MLNRDMNNFQYGETPVLALYFKASFKPESGQMECRAIVPNLNLAMKDHNPKVNIKAKHTQTFIRKEIRREENEIKHNLYLMTDIFQLWKTNFRSFENTLNSPPSNK
ncbi:hypothetical protein CEXT_246521 [Caerostris extrusa]|uniref:Uncharacterized protein n=1 Tax=Caerostris extrusa TaxID=172846 RepID=A0AAV4Q026_CAEEX|nr:hypothetical protein CEXT_246521 [Caerostris extrusa]